MRRWISSALLKRLDHVEQWQPHLKPNYYHVSERGLELMLRYAKRAEETTQLEAYNEFSNEEKRELEEADAKIQHDWIWPQKSLR